MAATTKTSNEVYVLPLRDDGSPDVQDEYIYLPPPTDPSYTLRFAIEGTSSICREGTLWTNIPAPGEKFERSNYRSYKLKPNFHSTLEINLPITTAGAFSYYVTYSPLPELSAKSTTASSKQEKTAIFYIDVSPHLSINGKKLEINALGLFSILSKFVGKYPQDWESHLRGIGQRNYNMVHFTPLMKRGESNSPYSIYDQVAFDSECFPNGEKDIAAMVKGMEKDNGLLALTDVVWNHTANNSKWLEVHPDAGYNILTAPWLESALDVDTALVEYGEKLTELGLPTDLKSVDDLLKIIDGMKSHVIEKTKLWQFYVVHVENASKAIIEAWKSSSSDGDSSLNGAEGWSLKQKADYLLNHDFTNKDRLGARFERTVKPSVGAAFLTAIFGKHTDQNEGQGATLIKQVLDEVNLNFYKEYDADAKEILEQVFNRIKYVRLDEHGPKLGPIDAKKSPLIEPYFTRLPQNDKTKKHDPKSMALVNNGWMWAGDAMIDHAGPKVKAYTRREIIVWSDCVKLRYGGKREDSPFLWDFMAEYTRLMAKYFAGFRIDNCHSTPIAVAEYLLDEARRVRSNLVIFAELFTGSEQMDYLFVKRLGLSALIREAMQCHSTAELSRLVHMHGGRPIGSFNADKIVRSDNAIAGTSATESKQVTHRIQRSPVHALFMDCTHDNEVPAQKRQPRDTLPNAALVNMCNCATGSVMGYDEIYPKLIELVTEKRKYTSAWSDGDVELSAKTGGIGGIKKLLNQIHVQMGQDGFTEMHVHHEGELITVHRVHPHTRKGYFLIAHTAFPGYGNGNGGLNPVNLTATQAKLIGSWTLEVDTDSQDSVINDKAQLKGLPSKVIELSDISVEAQGDGTRIEIPSRFPPGSIALFETWIPSVDDADSIDTFVSTGASKAFGSLDLTELNFVLYRCDAEERDFSNGQDGVYSIPNSGALVYAGLQGWWSVLKNVIANNDLGHPICNHLRDGPWPMDYIVGRLEKLSKKSELKGLEPAIEWLRSRFDTIKKLPSFLVPRYFALAVQTAYSAAFDRAISIMSDDVKNGQGFFQSLAMVAVQQCGVTQSASLWPMKSVPSLAAGLPHFSVDWARCWGRDVFISLRGLLLGTGRYGDAKEHILAFASVLKHGMIPNLLSGGKLPRYNSRDSVWFFLQNIQDYVNMAPDGSKLLSESVKRRFFPYDDTWFVWDDERAYSKSTTIAEVIQEAMQRHASGMSFREANAGDQLDMQMKSEGFDIEIHTDWETGIIFGGSQSNCGTWMDKMGESEKAGSKGVPGTPRDGAAVEITGLLYSTLRWLEKLSSNGTYQHKGVKGPQDKEITWKEWADKIQASFEKCYYVPSTASEDSSYDVDSRIINRRGIYKDLYRSGKPYEDYQLRPNFPIAMTVAPDLFDPKHAMSALLAADSFLRGPTGMATLDPSDMNYRGNYDNSEDSNDFATSKGRNYHQGPEWLWPTGFFLRALLKFDLMNKKIEKGSDLTAEEKIETFQHITRRLEGCKAAIEDSPWAGLTELTNANGQFCRDSSPTQAWSAGCLIDLFYDAKELAI